MTDAINEPSCNKMKEKDDCFFRGTRQENVKKTMNIVNLTDLCQL